MYGYTPGSCGLCRVKETKGRFLIETRIHLYSCVRQRLLTLVYSYVYHIHYHSLLCCYNNYRLLLWGRLGWQLSCVMSPSHRYGTYLYLMCSGRKISPCVFHFVFRSWIFNNYVNLTDLKIEFGAFEVDVHVFTTWLTTTLSVFIQTSYNSFIDLQDKLHQNLGRYI